MSSTIGSELSSVSTQRVTSRSASVTSSRLASRPTANRELMPASDAVATQVSSVKEVDPTVVRANPAGGATGDMLETMAEVLERYKKATGEAEPVSPPSTTLEVCLLSTLKKSNSPYDVGTNQEPNFSILA